MSVYDLSTRHTMSTMFSLLSSYAPLATSPLKLHFIRHVTVFDSKKYKVKKSTSAIRPSTAFRLVRHFFFERLGLIVTAALCFLLEF